MPITLSIDIDSDDDYLPSCSTGPRLVGVTTTATTATTATTTTTTTTHQRTPINRINNALLDSSQESPLPSLQELFAFRTKRSTTTRVDNRTSSKTTTTLTSRVGSLRRISSQPAKPEVIVIGSDSVHVSSDPPGPLSDPEGTSPIRSQFSFHSSSQPVLSPHTLYRRHHQPQPAFFLSDKTQGRLETRKRPSDTQAEHKADHLIRTHLEEDHQQQQLDKDPQPKRKAVTETIVFSSMSSSPIIPKTFSVPTQSAIEELPLPSAALALKSRTQQPDPQEMIEIPSSSPDDPPPSSPILQVRSTISKGKQKEPPQPLPPSVSRTSPRFQRTTSALVSALESLETYPSVVNSLRESTFPTSEDALSATTTTTNKSSRQRAIRARNLLSPDGSSSDLAWSDTEPTATVNETLTASKSNKRAKRGETDKQGFQLERQRKRQEKEEERQRLCQEKQEERQRRREEKDRTAAEKKRWEEANRLRRSRTETIKELIVELDQALSDDSCGFKPAFEVLRHRLEEAGAQVRVHRSVLEPPLIRFSRKTKARWDEARRCWVPLAQEVVEEETTVLVYIDPLDLIRLIEDDRLVALVHDLRSRLSPEHQIFFIVQGLAKLFSRIRTAENRAYTARIRNQLDQQAGADGNSSNRCHSDSMLQLAAPPAPPSTTAAATTTKRSTSTNNATSTTSSSKIPTIRVSQDKVDTELLKLQLHLGCFVVHVHGLVDCVESMFSLIADLSIRPHKRLRDRHLTFSAEGIRHATSSEPKLIWKLMLQQIPRITPHIAHSISQVYPSLTSLYQAYQQHQSCSSSSDNSSHLLLSNLEVNTNLDGTLRNNSRRQLGTKLSKRILAVFLNTIPDTLVGAPIE